MEQKKTKSIERFPTTLILFIAGHCNDAGNLILPDRSILKKKHLYNFIRDMNAKNVIVIANGHYSEKLVKHLSQVRSNFFDPNSFFGVFSHAGSLCSMSLKHISDKNSTAVKFILDIFKKQKPFTKTFDSAREQHITIGALINLVNKRLGEECGKCLKPIERNGGRDIPVAYLQEDSL